MQGLNEMLNCTTIHVLLVYEPEWPCFMGMHNAEEEHSANMFSKFISHVFEVLNAFMLHHFFLDPQPAVTALGICSKHCQSLRQAHPGCRLSQGQEAE